MFSPPTAVTAATGAASPSVGLDDAGRALIAWDTTYTGAAEGFPYAALDNATISVGSATPSVAHELDAFSRGAVDDPSPIVRMNSSGQALVVWEHAGGSLHAQTRIKVARSSPGRAPRTVATLQTDESAQDLASAVGSRGEAVVAWTNLSRPDQASVASSARSPFAPPTTISTRQRDADAPQVAIDQRGQAIIVWRDLGPSGPDVSGSSREPLLYATATLR